MFIGHFAAGMAGKKLQPSVSLGTLFLSAQFPDLLWPTLLVLDIEQVAIAPGVSAVTPLDFTYYPFSHSLLSVLLWSLLFSVIYYLAKKDAPGAILAGSLVLSHWFLDLIVHLPDLPLFPGDSAKVGFGVWNSPLLTVLMEGGLFIAGILLYTRARTNANQKTSPWFWSLVLFLVVIYVMNLTGPPPPNVSAIAWTGHLQWLFVIWAWWADRK